MLSRSGATRLPRSFSEAATDSDRIRTTGGSDSADLYATGNDDAFQSYGSVTFNMAAADFGVGSVSDIDEVVLSLTYNDRTFTDGTQFELFFSSDDFDGVYSGLTYDDSGANDPNGINASQFASLTSLGVYDLGFDVTVGANGGLSFDYTLDISAIEAELAGELNAGSDFTLVIGAVNNADDITFSGVANGFDPGDPTLTISAIPEPSAVCLLILGGTALLRRR